MTTSSPSDERWMRRALEIASRGRFTTWPNPVVGCVVVSEGKSLGEGWHATFGEAHAEVNALNQIGPETDLSSATAYVTLEPCCHTGKTPPCADLLIQRGVGRVIIATEDPNPKVAGKGVQRLVSAGIEVCTGCLQAEAQQLNRKFFHAVTTSRPWITLKWAQSTDGFIDPEVDASFGRGGHALTGAQAARHTHGLRSCHDGIMVGMRTWLVDRPSLTTRHVPGRQPARFILTSGQTMLPSDAPSVSPSHPATMVCPDQHLNSTSMRTWQQAGYDVVGLKGLSFSKEWWDDFKAQTNVQACLVEGGAQVAQGVLTSEFWDELHVLTSKLHLNSGLHAPSVPDCEPVSTAHLGDDLCQVWNNESPKRSAC